MLRGKVIVSLKQTQNCHPLREIVLFPITSKIYQKSLFLEPLYSSYYLDVPSGWVIYKDAGVDGDGSKMDNIWLLSMERGENRGRRKLNVVAQPDFCLRHYSGERPSYHGIVRSFLLLLVYNS